MGEFRLNQNAKLFLKLKEETMGIFKDIHQLFFFSCLSIIISLSNYALKVPSHSAKSVRSSQSFVVFNEFIQDGLVGSLME